MRIAVPVKNGLLNEHFGQTTVFWTCDISGDPPAIIDERELKMETQGGCGLIPQFLALNGVELVIAGGMGSGAAANLNRCSIQVMVGAPAASPRQIVSDLLSGQLVVSGQSCQHHDHASHGEAHHHAHGQGESCCSHNHSKEH